MCCREYRRGVRACRPNPLQWVWYAFGGKLPDHLAEWVLHDLTTRTWVLRHLSRTLAQCAPTLLLLLLPGPLSLRLSLPLLVLIGALYVSASYLEETTEHRALKHGFTPGLAKHLRAARVATARLDRDHDGLHDS